MTRYIKFLIIIFLGFLIFFILLKGLENPNQYLPNKKTSKIDLNLNFKSLFDKTDFTIGDLIKEDDYYLINVWASWCLPCKKEHSYLMNMKNDNLNIIGVNYKDKESSAKKFIFELGNPYSKILLDINGTKSIELGAIGVPETYLFKKTSKSIIKRYIGPLDQLKVDEIKNIIKNEQD